MPVRLHCTLDLPPRERALLESQQNLTVGDRDPFLPLLRGLVLYV